MKLIAIGIAAGAIFGVTLAACDKPADVVSQNISTDADNFRIARKIVFYNSWDSSYMLEIDGYCSLGNHDAARELSVTCKVGPSAYKKHFLGLSDNVTYFVQQIDPAESSPYHYKVIFNPSTIIPSIERPAQ